MKASRLGLLVLGLFAACGSDDPPAEGGSLSGILPGSAYFGRSVEVVISGVGTHFAGQPTLTFNDPAVRTEKIDVLSPTSLRATVVVGADAATGPHDVIVMTPGLGDVPAEVSTLVGGLLLSAPLRYEAGGTAQQGGLVDFVLVNQDKDNPFGAAPRFTSGAVAVRFTEVAPGRIAGTALVDLLAPIGGLSIGLVARNARGDLIGFAAAADDPLAPRITAAAPVLALAPGKIEGNEAIRAPRHTNLYKVSSPSDDSVFFINMKSVGGALRTTSGTQLVGAMAPASGKFGEGARFETTFDSLAGGRAAVGYVKSAGDAFFAIHTNDLSGGPSEYNYSVSGEIQKAVPFSMKEPGTPDTALLPLGSIDALEGPYFASDGAIDTKDDADFLLFTPTKGGRIFVSATPIDSGGPLNVAIFGDDPGTASCTAYLAGGTGTRQAEATTVAGVTYCARVSSTSSMTMKYRLVITPEL